MGKPSVTNIRPPSKSPDPIWMPPQTTWDLNSTTDWNAAVNAGWAATNNAPSVDGKGGDAKFDSLVGSINTGTPTQGHTITDVTTASMTNDTADNGPVFNYVFFGVNGGEDETVTGKTDASGIIVTGNGKDNVTGGDQADLIFSGNGKDTVNGGGGNDTLFAENGPDTLNGGKDEGTAALVPGGTQTVLVINDDIADLWATDPNGTSQDVAVPNKTTVSKEGVYIAVDADGHPTELAGGDPVIHVVYSITPETTGDYTLAYTHGSDLDGAGNPQFDGPPPSDIAHVHLEAGKTYYYSIIYDPGHPTVRIDVFDGTITPHGGPGDPKAVATSQAIPAPDWSDFFHEVTEDGPPTVAFDAGDELIGGNGPDTFVWSANDHSNVDLIWDYNQGEGAYNPFEGDVLRILDTAYTDKSDLTTFLKDLDGDGNEDDLVIYVDTNQAIGLVGISSLNDVNVQFG